MIHMRQNVNEQKMLLLNVLEHLVEIAESSCQSSHLRSHQQHSLRHKHASRPPMIPRACFPLTCLSLWKSRFLQKHFHGTESWRTWQCTKVQKTRYSHRWFCDRIYPVSLLHLNTHWSWSSGHFLHVNIAQQTGPCINRLPLQIYDCYHTGIVRAHSSSSHTMHASTRWNLESGTKLPEPFYTSADFFRLSSVLWPLGMRCSPF